MYNSILNLDVNPIVFTLLIKQNDNSTITIEKSKYISHLLNLFVKNDSIILKSETDLSENNVHESLMNNQYLTLKFESTDAKFLSKLSSIHFPKSLSISCNVQHIESEQILSYNANVKLNNTQCLCFETRPLTAKSLRNLFQEKSNFYDKNDFFSEYKSDYDFDEISSKIYQTKNEFLEKEGIANVKN